MLLLAASVPQEGCDGMCDSYGERLKAARKKAGLKQADVAAILGVSQGNYSQWEANTRTPKMNSLVRIANAIGCDVAELIPIEFDRKNNKNTDNPYWERICKLSEQQRAKGMKTYGQGIESNPADIMTRIQYLQEELIDGLMYCEWIKEKLMELEKEKHD